MDIEDCGIFSDLSVLALCTVYILTIEVKYLYIYVVQGIFPTRVLAVHSV